MYKHFAIVTVLLTATMAIFASGEQTAADEAVQAQQFADAEPVKDQTPTLAMTTEAKRMTQSRSTSSSSHSISADFGVPMDKVGAEVQNMKGMDWSPDMFQESVQAEALPSGISPEVWERLSAEQKEQARRIFGPNNELSEEERLERHKQMTAASAIRARR